MKRKIKGIEVGVRFGDWTVMNWSSSKCIHVVCKCGSRKYFSALDLFKSPAACDKCNKPESYSEIEVGTLYFINCVREVMYLDPIKGASDRL